MNRMGEVFRRANSGRGSALALFSAVLAIHFAMPAQAAFLFEIDVDGADDGVLDYNPRFEFGGDTTVASSSVTSPAYGTTGGDSIFGGDGVVELDTYVYRHAPDSEPDNLVIPPGTEIGNGLFASGGTGGAPGLYAVYATWPFTDNVTGGLTLYEVTTAGDSFSVEIDQNGQGDEWVLLGQIDYSSGDITVTQQPTVQNSFISQRAYGLLFEAAEGAGDTLARFSVTKSYSDGNTDDAEVTLSCNNGLPLEQSFTISEGHPVVFVLTNFTAGEADCTVTETGAANGYTPGYDNGMVQSDSGCEFIDIATGDHSCAITNTLEPVRYTVNKEWLFSEEDHGIAQQVSLEVTCENFRLQPDGELVTDSEHDTIDAEDESISFDLYPNWATPATRCRAVETQIVSGIESDQGCADWIVLTPGGSEQSCTITNTVFFEGIPTLKPHGIALLALLMLGAGLVGVRRLA